MNPRSEKQEGREGLVHLKMHLHIPSNSSLKKEVVTLGSEKYKLIQREEHLILYVVFCKLDEIPCSCFELFTPVKLLP